MAEQDEFFLAAKQGRTADVTAMLAPPYNANPNAQDSLGNTPLHYAAGANHTNTVAALVKLPGINLNAQNNIGDTPLHKAAGRAGKNVVSILVKMGADTLAKNKEGLRPLDIAKDDDIRTLVAPTQAMFDYDDDDDDKHGGDSDADSDGDDE